MSYGFTKDELFNLHYRENLSTNEIARLYNCNRDTIRLAMKRLGVVPRGRIKHTLDDATKSELITLYVEKRLSTRQIGKLLGRTHDYISDKLKEIGIEVDGGITALQGDRNPNWNGGKTTSNGYIEISSIAICPKRKREHQAVMEKFIGRELRKNEVVHHIDGNKFNNDINNLALMSRSAHTRLHNIERWKNNVK